jgi:hypothetical protein
MKLSKNILSNSQINTVNHSFNFMAVIQMDSLCSVTEEVASLQMSVFNINSVKLSGITLEKAVKKRH